MTKTTDRKWWVLMAITAPISGALSDRFGSRRLGMLGMGLLAVGLFLLSRIGPGTGLWMVALGLAVAGTGTGMFISPNTNTSALMGSAPRARQGIASGVQAVARNFGMVLGIGLAGPCSPLTWRRIPPKPSTWGSTWVSWWRPGCRAGSRHVGHQRQINGGL
jgi:MFS family permease